MDAFITLKDILVVVTPIVVAYISYRSGKKTQHDIRLEVERITKEKEAETKQILEKIGAELESQKQLITWQNSMPQTNEYTNLLGAKRFGHVSALPKLCQDIREILQTCPSVEVLTKLNQMLNRIELPKEDDDLFPHEVPLILEYKMVRDEVNGHLSHLSSEENHQEDTDHADT